ncbi:hypothetical protein KKD81_01155 [Patescibacteria group bacterium]|nr:hypothetical protein [Patescibacteria group bacterium]MBU2158875.1 hypothetical protein [Patescibacteria group bacterium]MBU2220525.1 hypothetical protein [Patescibacteria group bacterium]
MFERPPFETPPKAANDNEGPDTRTFVKEAGPADLDLAKERDLRNTIDEIARTGDRSVLNDISINEAKKLVSLHSPLHAINAINSSSAENWHATPALYVAYLDLLDSFRDQVTPGN